MTKHKKEIPPQPIGKGLGANLTWLAAYKALNVCAIALTSLIIIVTVILLATTDIFIKDGKVQMHKETTNMEKLQR